MITSYYIAGQLVQPPVNQEELLIELKFREAIQNGTSIFSSTPNNTWRFAGNEAMAINTIVSQGFIFEGIPLRIDIYHDGSTYTLFDGYIDCTDNFYTSCGEVYVTCRPKQGIDWLSDVAGGVSFEKMFAENTQWFYDRFVYPPSVINSVPQWMQAMTAMITCVTTVIQLVDMVITFIRTIADFSGELWWAVILKLLFQIAYMIVLTQVVIAQMQNFILYSIQPVKYLCGMTYEDLLQSVVDYFQFSSLYAPEFQIGHFKDVARIPEALDPPQSNLFFSQLTDGQENTILKWLAKPVLDDSPSLTHNVLEALTGTNSQPIDLSVPMVGLAANVYGYLHPSLEQRGFLNGTPADLIREVKQLTNGKVVIDENNRLCIVRRDTKLGTNFYSVPDLRQDFHGYNTEDFCANIYITFQSDLNDKNTITEYVGTAYSVNHELKIVNNPQYKLLKGLKEIRIPLSLTKKKIALTESETIARTLIPFVEKIINHMVDFVNFHMYATWNFFVDCFEWVTNFFEEVVQWFVDQIEALINLVIEAINAVYAEIVGFINSMIAALNSFIDAFNTFAGGSIPHLSEIDEQLIEPIDFSGFGEDLVTFIVASSLSGVVAPFFGLMLLEPHNLVIGMMKLLGIETHLFDKLNKIHITGFDEDRMGMIITENDFHNVPKIVKLKNLPATGGGFAFRAQASTFIRVADDNETNITARKIFQKFYCIDTFARCEGYGLNVNGNSDLGKHNQYIKYKLEGVPFCFDDYVLVANDNVITDVNGNYAELDSLLWNVYTQKADLSYRINQEYNVNLNGENNFKLSHYEPNGNTI